MQIKSLNKKKKTRLINLLLSQNEEKVIRALADNFTNGNLSAWMRYASMNYVPKKNELE